MDKSSVDIFLELKDSNRKTVEGECLDSEFSVRGAIEISEFKLDGDSAESRSSSREEDDSDDEEDKPKKPKKKSKKSGPLCTFEVTKVVDKASSALMLSYLQAISSKAAVLDHQFSTATVTVRKSGGGQVKFLILKFGDVSVLSYSLDVKSEMPEETLKFKFMQIQMQYNPQNPDGTVQVMKEVSWDFYGADDE